MQVACRGHSGGGAEGSRQQPPLADPPPSHILRWVGSRRLGRAGPSRAQLSSVWTEMVRIRGFVMKGVSPEGCEGALGVGEREPAGET